MLYNNRSYFISRPRGNNYFTPYRSYRVTLYYVALNGNK